MKSSILLRFGKRVAEARKRRGLSQEKLAELADVHRTYIGMIERGEKNVTLLTIYRVASALGVTAKDLVQ